MNEDIFMKRLKERLLIEFKKQDRSGVYGYTQRSMAYNSNRIEGSTLTEKQTASMFETGTLYTDDTEVIFRAKDIEEMNGHFKMFNYIMKNIEAPLDEDLIVAAAKETGKVVTVEEHSVIGGLGSAVCDALSAKAPTQILKIGVNDVFGESGPALELLKKYGLDTDGIYEKVKAFL